MFTDTATISLGGRSFPVRRFGLRKWLQLETQRSNILKAVKERDRHSLAESSISYLTTAFSINSDEIRNLPWYEVIEAVFVLSDVNVPRLDFPMLTVQSDEKNKTVVWDYDGRDWYTWANKLAKTYGWDLDYIANLDIDDAIGLLQEILSDAQDNREWEWGLSEIAYSYNETTKKSEFKELPRPKWMIPTEIPTEIKKVSIHRDFLPVGNVIKYDPEFGKSDTTV